ncbi:protein scar2 [Phtheirospermum japonicum]|uniref:Protein SCAR n=1 Tax=Phtheirospermum japonicum TaxID=374723 RepID=A0A830BMD9_9LAMI|nr:protein scar2 [Phtheirospermum japonicum]
MPISRYEIRNEYSLADPELYRAADKDDPEALLEGVAMAGLVGVLRQLGDLAEFAADIFHNLHEEVMATAARGHGLMSRVQQLETEIPSIERAFLAQTDHSSFFTNPGVDWHPNIRIDQNLVTQGDLPRLVMDSYEECRPPPRLFILDKFDVAGAGACLKRYTDPSFFKKKGPRWKNRETPATLPTSHTKLHQLFLEEARIENNVSNPTRRAKLKRKLNGFPFNSKTGKSYMEKLLQHPSPDNKEVTFDHNESGLEVVEIRPVSRDRENVGRKRSPPSSPDRESNEVPNLYSRISTDGGISSISDEKVIAVDDESNRESYQSDDIVSEVDNYVDATSNAESDTDADSRAKSDFAASHIKNESLISDVIDENLQTGLFDSQSTGDSTISDDGNNSSRKGMLTSFTSDSPSTSAENPRSERISYRGFSSDHVPEVDASSYHKTADDKDFPLDQHSKPVVTDKTDFTLDDEKKKSNLVMEPPCSPSVSDSDLQSGDESRRSSAGEHMVDEPNGESIPYVSTVPYSHYHTTDSSDKVTSDLLHGDESEQEDRNSVENIAFEINNVNSQNANGTPSEPSSSENLIPGKLDDDFQKLPKDIPSDYPDIVHNRDNIKSTGSREENLINGLDNEDPGVSTDSPNQFPSFMDSFLKKKLGETSSADAQTIDSEDDQNCSTDNQICSENFVFSHQANSFDWPQAGLDAHEGDVPDEETTVSGTFVRETHNDLEVQESPFSTPGELKEPAGTSEFVEMDRTKSNDLEVTEISDSADQKSPDEVDILLGEPDSGEENSNTADIASAVPALSDNLIIDDVPSPVGLNNLEGEDSGIIGELKNDENSLSERHEESGLVEKVDQTVLCNTIHNDNPNCEVLSGTVPNAHLYLEVDQDLKLVLPEIIQPPVEQNLSDREHESEESIVQEGIGSLPTQLDQELVHSSEINSEVSPVLPIIHQQTPDHDDLKGDKNSELDVPEDSLDSVPPPSNPFSETNQINLGDLAPLPPLPPAQWMTGKLQLGSSSTEGETMKHDELLFPQFITRPIVPTEETKNLPIQIAAEPASEEEKVVESPCVEVNSEPGTVDLPPKSENKQQLIVVPTIPESEVTSPTEVDGVGNGSRTLRKVTERVLPQVQKVDERDSLLEQIRTKSFNLRPALASRPSVRGPSTNLKVAAIVEKANAIRQALADSDEDDDSWKKVKGKVKEMPGAKKVAEKSVEKVVGAGDEMLVESCNNDFNLPMKRTKKSNECNDEGNVKKKKAKECYFVKC